MLNAFYSPKKSKWIFLFLLLAVSLIYNYHEILFRPPGVIHQWRQCDCLAIASSYFQFHNDFLSPAVFCLGNGDNGAAASEFPLIYYLVAQLWKIFGKHEYIFRLLNLSIVYTGLFFLFRFIEEKLKDSFWGIVITLLVFTSPILVYYSNGFLMDPLGLSFAFIAWYYFGKFYVSGNNNILYLSLLFFMLGGLFKVSSLISYFALLAVFVMEGLGFSFKESGKIFVSKKLQIIPFILASLVIYLWYSYAKDYNDKNGSGVFLVGILPIWNFNASAILARIEVFSGATTLHQFFNMETLCLVLVLFLFQIPFYKKSIRYLFWVNIFLFFAVIAFLLLWFGAITENHDYYLTNLLIFVAITLISFFVLMKNVFPKLFSSIWLKIAFTLILVYNVQLTSVKTAVRYFNTKDENFPSCYTTEDISMLKWTKYDFNVCRKNLITISPYLRSLGIMPDDKVISLPDVSFDITLYLMNQKGWSQSGAPTPLTEEWFTEKINRGAKYLIVNNPDIYKDAAMSKFTRRKLGVYKNIDIYDLRN